MEQLVRTVIPAGRHIVSQELNDLVNKIPSYLAGTVAVSTGGIYYNTFIRFKNFCIDNGVPFLPSEPKVIMAYLIKVSENSESVSPALAARSAIRHYNLLHLPNLPSPTDATDVAMMIKSIERKFSAPVKKRECTTPQIVRKFVDLLCNDQMNNSFSKPVEDWFLVAKTIVKFHCFARFEEVIVLKWDNFTILSSGNIEVTFLKAKNNQFHDARKSLIAKNNEEPQYCPVNLIYKYFHVLGRPALTAFFLPKIVCKQKVLLDQPASYHYCSKQFKAALVRIGMNPIGYGEHSDRIGGLSAAAAVGCSISDLQSQGRWKSDYAPKLYLKKSKEKRSQVSKVLNSLKSVTY